LPYVGTPPYFSGTASSSLVPHTFPVAIDGRPYMIDQKSGQFKRGYEQRVRDSTDDSTSPGEGAINPGGLWRRGQDSWHMGSGQRYADTAESKDYMFYKSKGINPWVKGQLSLLNATKVSLSSSATSQHMVVQDGRVYVSLNGDVKYTANPFASSPTWTDCTGEPGGSCQAMATDGNDIYLAFPSDGVRKIDTSAAAGTISGTKFVTGTNDYYMLAFAKGYMFGAHDKNLRQIAGAGSTTDRIVIDDPDWRWVGVATGQNAVYAAGYAGKKSLIYKITIKADGTLDSGVVALELPTGEVVTAISGYLGFVLIGTNKGVRYCSTDAESNLIAGLLIPTSGSVEKFASNDRFSYFTWTNYDGLSGGIGCLDLSAFTSPNTPAFATDLMYTSTNAVKNVVVFDDPISGVTKKVFTISGVGVIAEDSTSLVASGEIETGTWRWGIPDRKFVAKIDTRSTPLVGSITSYLRLDDGAYQEVGEWDETNDIENSFDGSDTRAIEAGFKFTLTRSSTATSTGPTFTRWMARAYAAPFRSQVFVIPVLLHETVNVRGKEYYYDVDEQQTFFDDLISSPRIVTLQMGTATHSVILEDLAWDAANSQGNTWQFNGTLTVTLRSVEN
jgi:hypothetical protein